MRPDSLIPVLFSMDLSSSRSLVSTSGSVASILPNPTIAAVPPAITSRASPLKSSLQQTTEVLSKDLLEPRVSDAEAAEYERYVTHTRLLCRRDSDTRTCSHTPDT